MSKLRFLRPWRAYRAGQVVEIPAGMATELVAKRVAVHDRQELLIETAAVETAAETADATPKRRGRRAVSQPDPSNRTSR